MDRTDLLIQPNIDVQALAVDVAQSIEDANSIEKMLAHQMALAHKISFQLADKAVQQREPSDVVKLVNASARMMSAYQAGALTLQRLRTGGRQVVTVQHVQVNGGQAVVTGSLQTGGQSPILPGNKE